SEVEILMQELGKHVRDNTQILFGTAVDGRMGNRLSVTIISSLAAEDEIAPESQFAASEPIPTPAAPIWEEPQASEPPAKIDILSASRTDSSGGEPDPIAEESPSGDLIPFQQPGPEET